MTGSGVMTIFVCKGLTRNPKTGNTPIWVLPNTWGELEIPNLARMFVIKRYWMLQITSVANFTVSEVLRENQQGDKLPPLPTQIRVKIAIKLILTSLSNLFFISFMKIKNKKQNILHFLFFTKMKTEWEH